MKKIKCLIITLLFGVILLPNNVFAAGELNVSTGSINITKGGSATFTITLNNAAGRVDISSSNSSVASISSTSEFLDMSSATITVKGLSQGTATIKITAVDATNYDDVDITGQTKTINVTVKEDSITPPSNNNNTNNNNNRPNNNTPQNNLSTNNALKSIKIDGHELNKIDDNNYELTVSNNTLKINIIAEPDDLKAKINGTGEHELNVGENNIEIIVISESGAENKINVKITRKDGYYLEDLKEALNDKNNNVEITLEKDSKISKEEINEIKKSKKTVNLNYFNENKELQYTWIIDGSKIDKEIEILTSITKISEYSKQIKNLSNYAEGLNIKLNHSGSLPKGTKIKIYVGDKYNDKDIVNVYHYNNKNNKLELIKEQIEVKNSYVEFDIDHASEYFVTSSNLSLINNSTNNINIFLIISIIELLVIIGGLSYYFIKIKPIKK